MTISKSRESCMKSMTGHSENWPPKDWNGSRSCRSLSFFYISSRILLFVGFCVHGGVILPLFVPVVCSSVAYHALFVMPGRGPSHLSIVGQCPGARQMIREGCAFLA